MNHEAALAALGPAAGWRTSSYSQGQNDCIEIATVPEWVGIRDSKLAADAPRLALDTSAWRAFLREMRRH